MARRAHASHILLRQKSDAVRILSEIQSAKKPLKVFEKAAKKHSKCPSGQRGGDLGWFDERQMVREFSEACFEQSLKEVDRFVKTEYVVGAKFVRLHRVSARCPERVTNKWQLPVATVPVSVNEPAFVSSSVTTASIDAVHALGELGSSTC